MLLYSDIQKKVVCCFITDEKNRILTLVNHPGYPHSGILTQPPAGHHPDTHIHLLFLWFCFLFFLFLSPFFLLKLGQQFFRSKYFGLQIETPSFADIVCGEVTIKLLSEDTKSEQTRMSKLVGTVSKYCVCGHWKRMVFFSSSTYLVNGFCGGFFFRQMQYLQGLGSCYPLAKNRSRSFGGIDSCLSGIRQGLSIGGRKGAC
jgi:hypothetical protein